MGLEKDTILKRLDHLLELEPSEAEYNAGGKDIGARIMEMYAGALQLVQVIYGADSQQGNTLSSAFNAIEDKHSGTLFYQLRPTVCGVLRAMKGDVDFGLLGSVARLGAGEALGDFVLLAREALRGARVGSSGEGAKNVAAVLTAALYEDTIRRIAQTELAVAERLELHEVLNRLKEAGIFQGATVGMAQAQLKFRNDALHADWARLDVAVVEGCLAFVEGLLQRHFS